jgi:hypothetical protein
MLGIGQNGSNARSGSPASTVFHHVDEAVDEAGVETVDERQLVEHE